MKAFQKLLGGALIIQLLLGTVAYAATAPSSFALPNGFMYLELDTTKDNPLETHFRTMLADIVKEGTSNSETLKAIGDNIDDTTLGLSTSFHQSDNEPIFMLSVAMPESDFQTIVSSLEDKDLSMNNLGKDRIIYLTDSDFYFSYKDGNLIAASREGVISDLLNQTSPDSIANHPGFQHLEAKSSPESFFKFFINFAEVPEMDKEELMMGDTFIADLVKTEGFAVSQSPNGFTGILTIEPGPEFPIQSDKYSFNAELYKKISPENIVLYNESYKWAENLKDSMKLIVDMQDSDLDMDFAEIYQEMSDAIVESSGLDPETEMAPLFQERTAFAVHTETDKQYFPTFTLISEVNDKETLAKTILAKLHEKILESAAEGFDTTYNRELEWRADMEEWYADNPELMADPLPNKEDLRSKFYWTSTSTINGTVYSQITFDTNAGSYFYLDEYEQDPMALWTLSTAVTSDGLLIVTSMKDLESVISTNGGLSNDAEWKSSYEYKEAIDISYINFNSIREYIEFFAGYIGIEEVESGFNDIIEFLSPFKSMFSQSSFEDGYFYGKLKLNMDVSKLGDIVDTIKAMIESANRYNDTYDYDSMLAPKQTRFLDVENNAWYTEYVDSMDRMDIMNGYEMNQFKPGQSITRAEFVKTILQVRGILGSPMYDMGDGSFSDVPDGEWFTTDVYKAHKLGLVEGYNDGTFRPHQPITRAEATTIIIRFLKDLNADETGPRVMQFQDITTTDWFKDAVQKAYNAEIINGKNSFTFAPHDNLTRAETAAILERVMDYYHGF